MPSCLQDGTEAHRWISGHTSRKSVQSESMFGIRCSLHPQLNVVHGVQQRAREQRPSSAQQRGGAAACHALEIGRRKT